MGYAPIWRTPTVLFLGVFEYLSEAYSKDAPLFLQTLNMPTSKTDLKSLSFPDFINLFSFAGFVMTIVSIWYHSLLAACIYFAHFMILSLWAYKDRRGLKNAFSNPFVIATVSIVVFIIAGVVFYKSYTGNQTIAPQSGLQSKIIDPKAVEVPAMSEAYSIKYSHTNIRYDNAPYIMVLLSNTSSKNGIIDKQLVRHIVSEIVNNYGSKITIDIYDNLEALELMNKSDEINKLSGNRLSKKAV